MNNKKKRFKFEKDTIKFFKLTQKDLELPVYLDPTNPRFKDYVNEVNIEGASTYRSYRPSSNSSPPGEPTEPRMTEYDTES